MTHDVDGDEVAVETLDWFRRQMRTEGLRAARDTLLSICRDAKAQAPAKATAAGFILRAAGALASADGNEETEPHEMTADQLRREIARLERAKARGGGGTTGGEPPGGGVFE